MPKLSASLPLFILFILFISGCVTNFQSIDQVAFCEAGNCTRDVLGRDHPQYIQQVFSFFGEKEDDGTRKGRTFVFCDAGPETRQCQDEGLNVFVLGGLVIPGNLNIHSFAVSAFVENDYTLSMAMKPSSTYVKVPPVCQDATVAIGVTSDKRVTTDVSSIYCNWLVIGNVIVQIDLSVDFFDFENGVAGGNYGIQVNGTANGAGTGYFLMSTETEERLTS